MRHAGSSATPLPKPHPMICKPSRVATSPRQSLIVRFMSNSAGRAAITSGGFSSMTARVGRDLAWPPHYAISFSRRNFPAFWPRLIFWNTSVDSTVCIPPVGGEQWAPIRRMRVSARARLVPLSLPSPEKDRYCVTATRNSVIKHTQERGIESRKYLRRRRSLLSRWRCSLGFSFEQELVT